MNTLRRGLGELQGNLTMVVTIILGFLIIFLPLATIIGWYGIDRTNDSLRHATEANLSTLAEQVRDELERALIRPYQDIQTLANNEVIRSAERSPEEKLAELQQVQAFYDTIQSHYSVFLDISLIDLNGQEITSTDRGYVTGWTDKVWFNDAAKGRVTVSPPRYAADGDSGEVVMDYAAPVRDRTGKIISVIIGQMDMRTIWQITEGPKVGNTGYIRIIDGQGNIYAPSRMVFQTFDVPEDAGLPDVGSCRLDTYDERGETMVAGYIALREQFPNWYVWVSQPYDEA
ncbi:MAG: hypothetical protein FJZ95_11660, partial [Chloroflexi bacterium]|nr:hypothetical protein [Chloroflexota bacterium]